jgi:hypothetical protein
VTGAGEHLVHTLTRDAERETAMRIVSMGAGRGAAQIDPTLDHISHVENLF